MVSKKNYIVFSIKSLYSRSYQIDWGLICTIYTGDHLTLLHSTCQYITLGLIVAEMEKVFFVLFFLKPMVRL